MSCDKESPAGTWINSNCRCSVDTETRFITEAMQDWWITKTWENRMEWEGLEYGIWTLSWDNELKYLGVKLENRIKNRKLLAKNFWILLHPYLDPTHASLRPSPFFRRVSLVEYFCTQGLLTLVAGESHAQAFWSLLHVSVWSRWRWGMMNGLWTRH